MAKKKMNPEIYAPDGRTWKDVASAAHSVAARALVALAEVNNHADERGAAVHDDYMDVTEALYPGSKERAEQIVKENIEAIAPGRNLTDEGKIETVEQIMAARGKKERPSHG